MNKIEFKPYDRVLVRDNDNERWQAAFYDQYITRNGKYPHQAIGGDSFTQCIPYAGNEHLLGTTDKYVPKPWEPKLGETFFTILIDYGCPFYVTKLKWSCTPTYEAMYRLGNCFQTREEAEAMADKLNAILKGKSNPHACYESISIHPSTGLEQAHMKMKFSNGSNENK